MALNHSPSIVTSGLVFYFDASNNSKSWKGKPTTNFLSNPTQVFNSNEFSQYYDLRAIFETNGLVPYSLSFDMRANKNGSVLWYMQNGSYTKYNFVSHSLTATTTWQRFKIENVTPTGPTASWQANTPGDNRAMLATYTTYGSGVLPQVTNMQLELGSFATPFVNSSRSSTQSLLDLTNLNTITANSLTYPSDGTFNFNGSNNYLEFTPTTQFGNTNYTIEFILKVNAPSSMHGVLRWGAGPFNSTGKGIEIRFQSNLFEYTIADGVGAGIRLQYSFANIADGNFRHFAIVQNSAGTATLYVNGVSVATQSYSGESLFTDTYAFWVGRGNDGYLNGIIPVFKLYNRALNTSEIMQNFSALRRRYGI